MAFYIYDLTFLVLFSLAVGIFLWIKRKNLQRDGIMYLYRTKIGVKFINYVGKKYKKAISIFAFLGIVCGYILMLSMVYFLYYLLKVYLFSPELVRAIKIPPIMPLIPYLPSLFKVSFLPPFYFTYWILSIAIIAIFHEFAHGIVAKRYGVKIKTTGFGFLGPFLAAFVEPDDKQMQKKSKYQQMSILSAGVFTNLILAILFFLLLGGFFNMTYHPAGAIFNTYAAGMVSIGTISSIDGVNITNASNETLLKTINENNFTNELILGTNDNQLNFTKITAGNKTYYITIENLEEQLKTENETIILFEDMPAIKAGLRGVITQINDKQIKTTSDVSETLLNLSPEETITIITKDGEETLTYEIKLAEDPNEKGKPMIGIGYSGTKRTGFMGKIIDFFNFFKDPSTNYEPKFNPELVLFIYNLIWWVALINLSVALVNMWPVAIFDGGRFFLLTIWGITGSEKIAQKVFKIITYLILFAIFMLMVGWFIAIF